MRIALVVTPHSRENLRLAAQMGVRDVVSRYPGHMGRGLGEIVGEAREYGLKVSVVEGYIPHDLITHGKAGREGQLEGFKALVREMARLEVGVCCYNFMPDDDWTRTTTTALERGGALVTGFDARELGARKGGAITAQRLWENLGWFLERIVPVAEREGVLMALHPDDPPMGRMGEQEQIMVSPGAFDRLFEINDSRMNAMCFCQGTFASMGDHDIPGLIRHFGKRIGYVHFRDVRGSVPEFYETFHDNGKTDMAACMRAYKEIGYEGLARPDHVPTLEGESNELAGYHMMGRLFAVGYMRGLMEGVGEEKGQGAR